MEADSAYLLLCLAFCHIVTFFFHSYLSSLLPLHLHGHSESHCAVLYFLSPKQLSTFIWYTNGVSKITSEERLKFCKTLTPGFSGTSTVCLESVGST